MIDSSRLYKSGNPFKRPCPITTISSTRAEFHTLQDRYVEYCQLDPGKLRAKAAGAKPTKAEQAAHTKLKKGILDEKNLAEKLTELEPLIEKEEGVSFRVVIIVLQELKLGHRGSNALGERLPLPLS